MSRPRAFTAAARVPGAFVARALAAGALAAAVLLASCAPAGRPAAGKDAADRPRVVIATYSVLAALARDLLAGDLMGSPAGPAGAAIAIESMVPDGMDVHEWEPSAKDMDRLTKADLILRNGLGLEGGMEKALAAAAAAGVPLFTASDHVAVRRVRSGEGIPSGDPDQAVGAEDPHLWTDPVAMKGVAAALAADLEPRFGLDLAGPLASLQRRLDELDAEIRAEVGTIPPGRRKLVTGHESLGYFAQRYGFTLVGAVVPSLSSQAESSAADFAALGRLVAASGIDVIFTETGTPARTAQALARETGARAILLSTHSVPADGSYLSYARALARTITGALR